MTPANGTRPTSGHSTATQNHKGKKVTDRTRISRLVAPLAAGALIALAPAAHAQFFNIVGGGNPNGGGNFSEWNFNTDVDNVGGYGINDAEITTGPNSQGDAYDGAAVIRIGGLNGTSYAGNAPAAVGQFVCGGLQNINGLDIDVQYFVDPNSATVRVFASITNNGTVTLADSLAYLNNTGSDGLTQIQATGSGDLIFDTGDTYLVTDEDGFLTNADPANTFILFGQGAANTPSQVTTTVFIRSGTQGNGTEFAFSLVQGQTVSFLFFNRLSPTTTQALATLGDFTSLDTLQSAGLLTGLSQSQIGTVVNFGPGGAQGAVPEPSAMAVLGVMGTGLTGLIVRRRRVPALVNHGK